MKQVKAILFILFANVILLAHSFIPHQHVNGFVSFESHHSVHHDDRDHSTEAHHHNETDDKDHKGCNLKLTFFSTTNTAKCEYKYIGSSWKRIADHALPFNYERLGMDIQPFLSLSPPPNLNSFYSVYVNLCFGLRAPPLA